MTDDGCPQYLPPARKVHNNTIQRNALPTLLYPPLFHPLGANGIEAEKIQRYSLLTVAKVREEGFDLGDTGPITIRRRVNDMDHVMSRFSSPPLPRNLILISSRNPQSHTAVTLSNVILSV